MSNGFSLTKLFPKCLTTVLFVWTGLVTIQEVHLISTTIISTSIIITFVLSIYTYYKVIIVGPGSPLDFGQLTVRNIKDAEDGIELPPDFLAQRSFTLKHDGRFRVCRTCNVWKPDRCHHCSACDKCILKMDHHCPWFAECVGFKNQKYFVQFLIYTTVYAILVMTYTSFQIYDWFKNELYETEIIKIRLLMVWILSVAVFLTVTCFTGFSIYQTINNRTTIEMYTLRKYREELELYGNYRDSQLTRNIFDLGSTWENWCEVMGTSLWEQLMPVRTRKSILNRNTIDEKGLYFRINDKVNQSLLGSADLQNRLMRRLTPRSSVDTNR
ncbi:hypothetical protein Kpol_1014p29 [Vanderwaltozyma polyspora DSM 70294]|uniref:Palmitoyltransferase n=1 Tax=Vanderwaltozyma polyspora (strain ATCC 22028 / DSM 70294 / BCRC 21397 / CBS 2163 / NBRC 10782 / NRRL Y-8283 / UCD 57-17) TaxID=436907 RepID=A7TNF6_VANPO|nr:uncharacterized protein Kpol_1014p29 [Vanderwaltozyma polyspora DSM 70294]EDO16209.1 hypothetical protein Kpol_1014p29 [Vanderwaltozyma polyspora DSM 70294]